MSWQNLFYWGFNAETRQKLYLSRIMKLEFSDLISCISLRKGLNEIIRICMMCTLFAWDCSSIGQSTTLSRQKLRVRAPSVPTDPNTIKKKYINSSRRFLWKGEQIVEFHSPWECSLILFVVTCILWLETEIALVHHILCRSYCVFMPKVL